MKTENGNEESAVQESTPVEQSIKRISVWVTREDLIEVPSEMLKISPDGHIDVADEEMSFSKLIHDERVDWRDGEYNIESYIMEDNTELENKMKFNEELRFRECGHWKDKYLCSKCGKCTYCECKCNGV